ncbi:MAG TPA: divalent metal cation transporter [Alphaproteobacteria bacterium]|nr:divalent metal cation transporter [Alphaproteobacteria bacterium]
MRRLRKLISPINNLGPGLVTGAADDDPSGIATYSQGGAQSGYQLLWTMLLTYPLMVAIQLVSAKIGRVTGDGLAKNMCAIFPRPVVGVLVVLLWISNAINIGADLSAMGEVAAETAHLGHHVLTIGFALGSLLLQLFVPYRNYAKLLKWLTLVLLAYVGVLFTVRIDWLASLRGLIFPAFDAKSEAMLIVAIFGTTLSPYLFFWQGAQEIEELHEKPSEKPLKQAPDEAPLALNRIRFDTLVGMAVSNLVALAIMISTAATLHAHGVTQIDTAAQAAQALEPIAGEFAFALFALGIIGTGLLAIPVLAGSSAFAVGEWLDFKCGLEFWPWQAGKFYAALIAAVLFGLAMDFLDLNPLHTLVWSAVINGLISVPLTAAMMLVAQSRAQMGEFVIGRRLRILGWLTTAILGLAAAAFFLTL